MLVKITQNLISEVKAIIKTMAAKEEPAEFEYDLNAHEATLDAAAWGNHIALKKQMPAEWCVSVMRVRVAFRLNGCDYHSQFSVRGSASGTRFLLPPNKDQYTTFYIPNESALAQEIAMNRDARRKHQEKWSKVEHTVVDFLGKCSSLNEAVKAWEGVRLYVPADALARLEAKPAKRQKVAPVATEAFAELTALAAAHRMTA
jgi:hypothetical protein